MICKKCNKHYGGYCSMFRVFIPKSLIKKDNEPCVKFIRRCTQ